MEEDKAAAYYEELTRKGEGAARFKQGLGFSSSSSTQSPDKITKGSSLPSSSSFLSSFVKASSNPSKPEQIDAKSTEIDRNVQLQNIQNKLKKKGENFSRVSDRHGRDGHSRRRSRSRDRYDSRVSTKDRDHRDRDRGKGERRRRSRSRSRSDGDRKSRRSSSERHGGRRRSRSSSPRDKRLEKSRNDGKGKSGGGVDYARLIKGYAEMTPAERVKAKMKLQLSQTAEKDIKKGMGAGWERFDFNKDAPLDDDEDKIEEAEDDAVVVKKMGQSFRFAAVEARREEQIKAAHDEAMFGAPISQQPSIASREMELTTEDDYNISNNNIDNKDTTENVLISDTVLAKQQGSWRDRARRPQNG